MAAMAMQMPEGKGSRYQTTYKDAKGDYLDGGKTYKLTMPPNVPVHRSRRSAATPVNPSPIAT